MNQTVDLRHQVGSSIRTRRLQVGLTQESLALEAGLNRTYISDVERGSRNLSLDTIQRLARALDIPLSRLLAEDPVPSIVGAAQAEPPVAQAAQAKQVEILLVEDNPGHMELALRALQDNHVTNPIHMVDDGEKALDFIFCSGAYSHRRIEDRHLVLLLDLGLPGIHGTDVLRRLRADERTRSFPVVVLTVSQSQRDFAESQRLGIDGYIVKPVDGNKFRPAMAQVGLGWELVTQGGRGTFAP
ncbi:MAG: helix-turn-helix domain-containing protein [Armatimonadetes bacterium]|nr:helix-turn-helix domain-containing protein [Armatimonadota bacterium]